MSNPDLMTPDELEDYLDARDQLQNFLLVWKETNFHVGEEQLAILVYAIGTEISSLYLSKYDLIEVMDIVFDNVSKQLEDYNRNV